MPNLIDILYLRSYKVKTPEFEFASVPVGFCSFLPVSTTITYCKYYNLLHNILICKMTALLEYLNLLQNFPVRNFCITSCLCNLQQK